MRFVWLCLGLTALALGCLGVVLPLLPTVPFVLLAAFCFAQSSERLHTWLVTHRFFGPQITDWQTSGVIRRPAKIAATVSVGLVFSISLILGVSAMILLIQAVVLSAVLVFIWSRPDLPR